MSIISSSSTILYFPGKDNEEGFGTSTSIGQPVMSRRRWGTPIDAFAMMAAHRRLPSAMRSNGDIDRPAHLLMLSFHDLGGLHLRHLPSTVPCIV